MCISLFMTSFFTSPSLMEFKDVKNTLSPKEPTIPTESTDERAREIKKYHPCFTEGELKHEQFHIFVSGCTGKKQQMK